jgi:hypothetical protein
LQLANGDALIADLDALVAPCGQVLAHEIRPYRQLAMTPVDHYGKLHRGRPASGRERL